MFEFTREILTQSRTFTQGKRIRDVERLVRAYGGTKHGWKKKSAMPMRDRHGLHEYQWHEHHGIGRFEMKRVNLPRNEA